MVNANIGREIRVMGYKNLSFQNKAHSALMIVF